MKSLTRKARERKEEARKMKRNPTHQIVGVEGIEGKQGGTPYVYNHKCKRY